MNHEHYSDPTADIAIGRVMREWKKEVRNNERRKEAERKHILQDDTGTKVRKRKKRWIDKR